MYTSDQFRLESQSIRFAQFERYLDAICCFVERDRLSSFLKNEEKCMVLHASYKYKEEF